MNSHHTSARNLEGIDPDRLEQLKELGDDVLLRRIYGQYLKDGAAHIDGIRMAIDLNDATALRIHSHTLKGSSANVGVNEVAQLASQIQQKAEEENVQLVREMLPRLNRAFLQARTTIHVALFRNENL